MGYIKNITTTESLEAFILMIVTDSKDVFIEAYKAAAHDDNGRGIWGLMQSINITELDGNKLKEGVKMEKDNFYLEINNKIKNLIKEKNINKSELAESLGITSRYLLMKLHGDKELTFFEAVKIAKKLNINLESLYK